LLAYISFTNLTNFQINSTREPNEFLFTSYEQKCGGGIMTPE